LIQIDISNGTFAPSMTWPFQNGDDFYKKIATQKEGLPFWEDVQYEVDMLIDKPEEHIEDWINAGASKLIIHLETSKNITQIKEKTDDAGIDLGLSINPSTDENLLYENLEHADFVQFMGSDEIGFHGVELDKKVLPMIKRLREKKPDITIAIDIGVNEETAERLVQAGVNKLISGSAILNAEDPAEVVEFYKSLNH